MYMAKFNYEGISDLIIGPGIIKEWWRQTKEQFKIDPEVFKSSLKTVIQNWYWIVGGTLVFNLLVAFLFYTVDLIFIFFMTLVICPLAGAIAVGVITLKRTWSQPDFDQNVKTREELLNQNQKSLGSSPPTVLGREGQ